jgi:CheY-like chemotaxis protein
MKLNPVRPRNHGALHNRPRASRARSGTQWRPADAALRGSETVLVVDDEPVVRGVMTRILRQLGYRVVEASGTVEAERVVNAEPKIDLLLTDFSMPESNGLEFARWFRSRFAETPVLMVTGSLWELNYQAESLGEFAILTKPFTAVDLGRMVRRVLD